MPAVFDDIEIGQVVSLGTAMVDEKALDAFIAAFQPGWPVESGTPEARKTCSTRKDLPSSWMLMLR